MSPTGAAIVAHDVHVHYGNVTALNGATLTLHPGRVCALIGMNGSGKSTLYKTIMGLVRPSSGSILIDGQPPRQALKAGRIGYVPQREAVDWQFPISVHDVVMTGRYGHMGTTRRPRPDDRTAVAAALERVELADLAQRQIGQLSGGQRKRAFVARAIAQGAGILLLDEPFAGVDKRTETTIVSLLRELASGGTTILVSTHDLQALPDLADEGALLLRRILMHAPLDEVLKPENLMRAFGLDPTTAEEPW